MDTSVLFSMLFAICGSQNVDCSDVALISPPNTNHIYAYVCKPAFDKDEKGNLVPYYVGERTAYHMVGDHIHHVLHIIHEPCSST